MKPSAVTRELFEIQTVTVPKIVQSSLNPFIDLKSSTFIDFGCDLGLKTYGYSKSIGLRKIVGIDIQDNFVNLPQVLNKIVGDAALPDNLEFMAIEKGGSLDRLSPADGFISWSVFEHIDRDVLMRVAGDLFDTLRPGAVSFVQVNPLYLSPYGSHLRHILDTPWQHLFFEGDDLKEHILAKLNFNHQAAEAAWSLYLSLNRLRFADFVQCFSGAGFTTLKTSIAKTQEVPPAELTCKYAVEDLQLEGFQLVLKKPETEHPIR